MRKFPLFWDVLDAKALEEMAPAYSEGVLVWGEENKDPNPKISNKWTTQINKPKMYHI